MVWNCESFLYLPFTSWPINIASWTLPASTCERSSEKPISCSFWPVVPVRTTCHRRTADTTITAQKSTVLIVEFTGTPQNAALPIEEEKRPQDNEVLDASDGNSTEESCFLILDLFAENGKIGRGDRSHAGSYEQTRSVHRASCIPTFALLIRLPPSRADCAPSARGFPGHSRTGTRHRRGSRSSRVAAGRGARTGGPARSLT